ncbi:AAA family ATPase [Proteus mirabilis]|uniref:AAA family ATPase n=1 Tax=Proteus mirabilis TaxID=584 RepID=UPI0034D6C70D
MDFLDKFEIESFRIERLYGYKNISMKMKGKTTIFVSENGAGKTTILNALRMVLEKDFLSLRQIDCKSIFIKFRGHCEIEINNSDLKPGIDREVIEFVMNELGVNEEFWNTHDIREFINQVSKNNIIDIRNNSLLSDLYFESPYLETSFKNDLKVLMANVNNYFNKNNSDKIELISKILEEKEIIFLPTYRRVEKNIEIKADNEKNISSLRIRETKLHHDGISYGLRDVEERLKEITLDIERTSNQGYRALSARMLSDLIHHGNKKSIMETTGKLPLIEDLERFLSRVEKPSIKNQLSYNNKKEINIIESIKDLYESDDVKKSTYLYYFLTQLDEVIKQTKEQEYKIAGFVKICNKYLKSSGDSKLLEFDQKTLTVIVSDQFTGKNIALNDLSSGEKQVISLMAIKYLSNDRNKIILIDEPELSLSLKWQRMILPDLSAGDNIIQIIAITHSPFIFENELSTCVSPMKIIKESISD